MTTVYNWTMCPARMVEYNERRAVQVNGDRGHSRGRQVNIIAPTVGNTNGVAYRRFELVYDSSDLIVDEVERAWAATYGPVLALSYTPLGESAIEVRFAANTLQRVRTSVATGQVTIVLEEIR